MVNMNHACAVQLPLMGPDFQERMQRAARSGDDVKFRQEARTMAFSVASRCPHLLHALLCCGPFRRLCVAAYLYRRHARPVKD